jgi:hypothetical protein
MFDSDDSVHLDFVMKSITIMTRILGIHNSYTIEDIKMCLRNKVTIDNIIDNQNISIDILKESIIDKLHSIDSSELNITPEEFEKV